MLEGFHKFQDSEKEQNFQIYQKNQEISEVDLFVHFMKFGSIITAIFYIPFQMIITNSKQINTQNIILSFINIILFMSVAVFPQMTIKKLLNKNYSLEQKIKFYRIILFFVFTFGPLLNLEIVVFRTDIKTTLYPTNNFLQFWVGYFLLLNFVPLIFFVRSPFFQIFLFFLNYVYIALKFSLEDFRNTGECLKTVAFCILNLFIIINCLSYRQKRFKEEFEIFEYTKKKNDEWKNIFKSLPQTILIISKDKEVKYISNKFFNLKEIIDIDWNTYENFNNMLINSQIIKENNFENTFSLDKIIDKTFNAKNFRNNNEDITISMTSFSKNNLKFFIHPFNNKDIIFEFKVLQIDHEMNESFLFLIEDVSEKNMLYIMKKNEEFKNKLISSFSHELKTPISGSTIPLENCLDDPNVSEEIKIKYLHPIKNSLSFLECVANDMIDYGAISTKQFKLFNSEIQIKNLAEELQNTITPIAEVKKLNFVLSLEVNIGEIVIENDKNRIKQVCLNLLRNAVKFTNKGNIILKITQENLPEEILDDYPRIKIEVIDSGVGMNDDQQEELRKILFQHNLTNLKQGNFSGGGLGLIISQNIAKNIGPDIGIQFNSEINKGSNFILYLDDKKYEENSINIEIEEEEEKENNSSILESSQINELLSGEDNYLDQYVLDFLIKPGKKKVKVPKREKGKCLCPKILIVDDESFNIYALEMIISPFKIPLEKAFNGLESIKIMEQDLLKTCRFCNGIKLVFMDIQMPGINGIEATKQIKAMEKKSKRNIIIIACTAFNSRKDYDECIQAGMSEFLNKPISKEKIKNAIQRYLT